MYIINVLEKFSSNSTVAVVVYIPVSMLVLLCNRLSFHSKKKNGFVLENSTYLLWQYKNQIRGKAVLRIAHRSMNLSASVIETLTEDDVHACRI